MLPGGCKGGQRSVRQRHGCRHLPVRICAAQKGDRHEAIRLPERHQHPALCSSSYQYGAVIWILRLACMYVLARSGGLWTGYEPRFCGPIPWTSIPWEGSF